MWYSGLLERGAIPEFLIRKAIRHLNRTRLKQEKQDLEAQQQQFLNLLETLKSSNIAEVPEKANEQHYEVVAEFFEQVLGKHLKYSCCYWKPETSGLDEAEAEMLKLTCQRAQIEDGQTILDLGCGWGSLSLYIARNFPQCKITSVSNSSLQREFIEARLAKESLSNVQVITCDINDFTSDTRFDRVVSIEMFEHVRNYEKLLAKLHPLMKEQGKLFVHIFAHKQIPYLFEVRDEYDWMAKYFFSGGIMPSNHLLLYFPKHFRIEQHWLVSGMHYYKTCEAWLQKMKQNKSVVLPLLAKTYGQDGVVKWWNYWKIFFMACAELFAHDNGEEWMVNHYLFQVNH